MINIQGIRLYEGLESALNPKPQVRYRSKKLDGDAKASLVATACMEAPAGRAEWTMQLLADKLLGMREGNGNHFTREYSIGGLLEIAPCCVQEYTTDFRPDW